MATPSSPRIYGKSRAMTSEASVNINSKLRRNSLVSEHEDLALLREKLTRIAVGRHQDATDAFEDKDRRRYNNSIIDTNEHFKVLHLLPPERPNTPPSSPQPRDVLRKQLRLKQKTVGTNRRSRRGSYEDEDSLDTMMSVDDVEITPMEDVEEDNAVLSPPAASRGQKNSPRARLSIPNHLRVLSPFSVLTKYPEGLRKRKSAHVDATEDADEDRGSLKKTSSQINILATSSAKVSRISSAGGELFETFAARQRLEKDQEMEDVTQPQTTQKSLFGNTHGRLSACS